MKLLYPALALFAFVAALPWAHAAQNSSADLLMPLKSAAAETRGPDVIFIGFMGAVILAGAWLGRCHGRSSGN
jgi:hypothetical protein